MKKSLFGKNLTFLRKQKGLSVVEVANNIGFSRSQWSNYENNLSHPKFIDLIKIAKYFDMSESDLIHSDIENVPTEKVDAENYTLELQKKHIEKLENEIEQLKEKVKELSKEHKAIKRKSHPVDDTYTNIAAEHKRELKKR